MQPIISVENLGKKYRIKKGEHKAPYRTLRETLTELPKRLAGKAMGGGHEDFWALQDVSFDVMPGERIGIIGRNGAGKSTLLKLLSRITEPTKGKITLRGRVASLLEVGTGFHPELSGRENIFLNGAILGMHRSEIKRKFDEIVDFAGVEKFLDTPVKRYSSGMYVRLAFAVAAHLEPEILIVDEVLAVGDAEFQKKCLGKMEEVSKGQGRTVLFVSHNMAAIRQLCERGIFIDNGQIKLQSNNIEETITAYTTGSIQESFNLHRSPKNIFSYTKVILRNAQNRTTTQFFPGEPIDIEIFYTASKVIKKPCFGIYIKSPLAELFGAAMILDGFYLDAIEGEGSVRCRFHSVFLLPQRYAIVLRAQSWGGGRNFNRHYF